MTVPSHWKVRRLKQCATIVMGQSAPGSECRPLPGRPFLQGCGEFGAQNPVAALSCEHPPKVAPSDSILLSVRAPVGRLNWADQEYGIGRGLCAILSDRAQLLAKFAYYQLGARRAELSLSATGSTYDAICAHDIANHQVFLPPLAEQEKIVAYLDEATGHIDAASIGARQTIQLLGEQRRAVVSRTLSRGLRASVQNRPSGVPWLGDVPEHWEIRRLRTCATVRSSSVDKHTRISEHPVNLCNYLDVYRNDLITGRLRFMRGTASAEEIERFRVVLDDVLITKDSETWDDIGVPALVSETVPDLICGYYVSILRPDKRHVLGQYLLRVLQCPSVGHQMHVAAKGVTRYGLSLGDIKSVRIPLPPLAEQTAVAEHIARATAGVESAIAGVRREIDLLQEYRARLVSDIVTGKLEVRKLAERLPGPGGGDG